MIVKHRVEVPYEGCSSVGDMVDLLLDLPRNASIAVLGETTGNRPYEGNEVEVTIEVTWEEELTNESKDKVPK